MVKVGGFFGGLSSSVLATSVPEGIGTALSFGVAVAGVGGESGPDKALGGGCWLELFALSYWSRGEGVAVFWEEEDFCEPEVLLVVFEGGGRRRPVTRPLLILAI